ncbi:hypothetical protein M6D81_28330 [Paenibacillus sp. J5C_2022]|uniref:hypothetical protein n=1 Tax=Paenibacillus sp. J5C2022 TaxID=2977129 RepID=UPI0021CE19BD|nr:hypothetical protein [Paenibacillus sp. J5C2022]MCU6712613.1 hypothetical protein [Paenibacillus sp. J5C2022]
MLMPASASSFGISRVKWQPFIRQRIGIGWKAFRSILFSFPDGPCDRIILSM